MTDTTTQTPQVDPAQEKLDAIEITLTLTVKEVNGILAILGNLPFVQSAGLISAIQAQGTPQVQAALAADSETKAE